MDKVEALLWVQRAHEAIRKLPDNAEICSIEMGYNYLLQGNKINIHLAEAIDWNPVIPGKQYSGWREMIIAVTPFATAWWANHEEGKNGEDS